MEQILELLRQVEGDAHNLVVLWVSIWFAKHVITCATTAVIFCALFKMTWRLVRGFTFEDKAREAAGMTWPLADSEKREILARVRKGRD